MSEQPTPAPTPVPAQAVKPKQVKPPENDEGIWRLGRRNFLQLVGWLSFIGFFVTTIVGSLRFMFPRVLFEPPTSFRAGRPGEYQMGVSERFKDAQRVWLVKEDEQMYAIIAICTHLGCTPRWLDAENKFKCPCHGSGFRRTGMNFEGPAPRPLERAKISVNDDGDIVIDKSTKFLYEKGEWGKPGSFIKV